jgi:hypothetical protein
MFLTLREEPYEAKSKLLIAEPHLKKDLTDNPEPKEAMLTTDKAKHEPICIEPMHEIPEPILVKLLILIQEPIVT